MDFIKALNELYTTQFYGTSTDFDVAVKFLDALNAELERLGADYRVSPVIDYVPRGEDGDEYPRIERMDRLSV